MPHDDDMHHENCDCKYPHHSHHKKW
jgi:hypothetical protein